jgi:hypothetical protein
MTVLALSDRSQALFTQRRGYGFLISSPTHEATSELPSSSCHTVHRSRPSPP